MKEVLVRLATPNWAYKLPIERYACSSGSSFHTFKWGAISLRRVDDAYRKLGAFMRSFVTSKKEELASANEDGESLGSDLLTRLVSASESEGKNGLNDAEVVSLPRPQLPH